MCCTITDNLNNLLSNLIIMWNLTLLDIHFEKKILDVSVLGSIFIIITPTHTPQTFISIIDYLLILTIITLCRCSIVFIGHCSKLDIIFISVYEIFSIYSAFAITFVVEGLKTLTNLFLSLKFNKDSWFWIKYCKILKVLIKNCFIPTCKFCQHCLWIWW